MDKIVDKKKFGIRMMLARKEKGLTQTQLAKLIGTDQGRIAGYETGKWFPDTPRLYKIAVKLNRTLAQLTGQDIEAFVSDGNTVRLPVVSQLPLDLDKISDFAEGEMSIP